MKTTTKKKHPPSPKLLAHLKRLNLARRKKGKKPSKPTKPAAKPAAKATVRKKPKAKPAPAPKPPAAPVIPPVELPKGDCPGQTTMPVVEAAVSPAPTSAAATGEELL